MAGVVRGAAVVVAVVVVFVVVVVEVVVVAVVVVEKVVVGNWAGWAGARYVREATLRNATSFKQGLPCHVARVLLNFADNARVTSTVWGGLCSGSGGGSVVVV